MSLFSKIPFRKDYSNEYVCMDSNRKTCLIFEMNIVEIGGNPEQFITTLFRYFVVERRVKYTFTGQFRFESLLLHVQCTTLY